MADNSGDREQTDDFSDSTERKFTDSFDQFADNFVRLHYRSIRPNQCEVFRSQPRLLHTPPPSYQWWQDIDFDMTQLFGPVGVEGDLTGPLELLSNVARRGRSYRCSRFFGSRLRVRDDLQRLSKRFSICGVAIPHKRVRFMLPGQPACVPPKGLAIDHGVISTTKYVFAPELRKVVGSVCSAPVVFSGFEKILRWHCPDRYGTTIIFHRHERTLLSLLLILLVFYAANYVWLCYPLLAASGGPLPGFGILVGLVIASILKSMLDLLLSLLVFVGAVVTGVQMGFSSS